MEVLFIAASSPSIKYLPAFGPLTSDGVNEDGFRGMYLKPYCCNHTSTDICTSTAVKGSKHEQEKGDTVKASAEQQVKAQQRTLSTHESSARDDNVNDLGIPQAPSLE